MINLEAILSKRYVLESQLERGEFLQLYKIKSTIRDRYETLVMLEGEALRNEVVVRDFEVRFRQLANLDHPSIPNIIESFKDKEHYFLITNALLENTLTALLESVGRPLAFTDVFAWSVQLLSAVEYLHKHNFVHRDIKPDNILITTEGRVLLSDFGIAKELKPSETHSSHLRRYTNTYSAPEVIDGKFDERGDLYSLAAVIYHMLTGVKPPDAWTRGLSIAAGLLDPLRFAREVNPQIPTSVAHILRKSLEISPTKRPATASLMRLELDKALEGIDQEHPPVQPMISENSPEQTIERMKSFAQRKGTLLEMLGGLREADSR